MTAQAEDYVTFKRTRYQLLGIHAKDREADQILFDPANFGLKPTMMSTGCYRGFYCTYRITGGRLYLENLTVRDAGKSYPPINDVGPDLEGDTKGDYHSGSYANIRLALPFTGRLRLASRDNDRYHRHMGFQETISYKKVIDLVFENGCLVDEEDLSGKLRLLRSVQLIVKEYLSHNWLPRETIRELKNCYGIIDDDIGDSFSRHFRTIDPHQVIFILEKAIASKRKPGWFINNFAECYDDKHSYARSFAALGFIGIPDEVQEYLMDLENEKTTEEQVVLSFLKALLESKAKKVWCETLHVILGRAYEKSVADPGLKKLIRKFLSNSTTHSWGEL